MIFDISNPSIMFILMLAGPMTVIPLFFFVKGVHLAGLGPSGMFFSLHQLFSLYWDYFLYNEPFDIEKLISFFLIWVAVIIYL